jgi:ketosteroid isomerase-like protein
MRKIIISSALLFLLFTNLYSQMDMQKEKDALKQVDIDFSNLSKEKGMKEAFLAYVASNGVLLRPYTHPVEGFDAVKKFLDEGDANFTLTWVPSYADVSISGELGYTYGLYELTFKDEQGILNTRKGTYVSIWKKNEEGKWKYTLDTGNPGLEPKQ